MKRTVAFVLAAAGCTGTAIDQTSQSAVAADTIATPELTCGAATETTLEETVCAGATGLPAGFTLQWQVAAGFQGWSAGTTCDASFSGNAKDSRYALAPFACVTVVVGDFVADNGFSTSCPGALACGTEYVFRAFGHATSDLKRSPFSADGTCSTASCTVACTQLSQGYWKNHTDAWPVDSLLLGTVAYDAAALEAILQQAPGGPGSGCDQGANGLIALAHQLIAAKLNVAAGATAPDAIAQADALIGGQTVTTCVAPTAESSALTDALDGFNTACEAEGD